jgi:hypothetical protein
MSRSSQRLGRPEAADSVADLAVAATGLRERP